MKESLLKDFLTRHVDLFGIGMSALCLLHCLLLPVAVLILPGLFHHHGHQHGTDLVHAIILVLATPTAIYAFGQGLRRHHSSLPLQIGSVALAGLWLGFFFEGHSLGAALTLLSSVGLIYAHGVNFKLKPCCLS